MIPASALGQLNMASSQPGPSQSHGAFLADFPAAAIDALVAVAGPDAQTPPNSVEVRHLGGALARPARGGGAQPGIDASHLLFAAAAAPPPGLAGPARAHVQAVRDALAPSHPGAPATTITTSNRPGRGRRGDSARFRPPPAGDQGRLRPRPGDPLRPSRLADPALTCAPGAPTAMSRGTRAMGGSPACLPTSRSRPRRHRRRGALAHLVAWAIIEEEGEKASIAEKAAPGRM